MSAARQLRRRADRRRPDPRDDGDGGRRTPDGRPDDRHRLDRSRRRLDRLDRRARGASGSGRGAPAPLPDRRASGSAAPSPRSPTATCCSAGSTRELPRRADAARRRRRRAGAAKPIAGPLGLGLEQAAARRPRDRGDEHGLRDPGGHGRARTRSARVRRCSRTAAVAVSSPRPSPKSSRCRPCVVPRAPANFSAWGILTSDYREDAAVTTRAGRSTETADARGSRDPPGARGAKPPRTSRPTASTRGPDRAGLSRRHALRRAGPHDHRAGRGRVARRPCRACSPASRSASSPRTASCTATATSTRRSSWSQPGPCGRTQSRVRPCPEWPATHRASAAARTSGRCASGARGRSRRPCPTSARRSRPASRARRSSRSGRRRSSCRRAGAPTSTGSAICCSGRER